ncbi:hypothetical protein ACFL2G_03060 [Candidatus Omnitrophota bacterium]
MKKSRKLINVLLIFVLMSLILLADIAYSFDMHHLRLPMGISKRRFYSALKQLELDIEWITRDFLYKGKQAEIPQDIKTNITDSLLNINNGFLKKTISSHLKRNIKIEELERINRISIELFQQGKRNHILKVTTFLGDEKVIFGLVVANEISLNNNTEADFSNILFLRKLFPKFSDLLQNPYALSKDSFLTMFSCEWFDDYYELGLDWNKDEREITFFINDSRLKQSEGFAFGESSRYKFSKNGTADIIEEISRMLTIFFDEERKLSIDLGQIIIDAGDFTHYKDVSELKLKLITIRNIKNNQSINKFVGELMYLDRHVLSMQAFDLSPRVTFLDYKRSIEKGILKGLQDRHGKVQGIMRFKKWCDNSDLLKQSTTANLLLEVGIINSLKKYTDL